jgi:hypothetical protein
MYKKSLLAVALLSTGFAVAQEPGEPLAVASQDFAPWSLKARIQVGMANVDGVENGIGIGLNRAFPVGPGCFNAEVGYQQFFGTNYDVAIPPNTIGLNGNNAKDSRKHTVSGFAFRLGYQQGFADEWTWQAGVSVNYFLVHNQASAQFGYFGGAGYWDETIDKSRLSLSPYAGARWDLNQYSAFELNLLLVSYQESNIYPIYSATSVTSGYSTRNVFTPKLEIGYVFKF